MSTEFSESSNQRANTISLLDLIAVLVKHRFFIFFSTFLAAIFIVLYSLYSIRAPIDGRFNFLPNFYRPEVKIRLLDQEQSSISSILSGSDLGILASLAGGDTGGSSSSDLAQALLIGNKILDSLVEEFEIIRKFNIEENPRTTSRQLLRGSFATEFNSATGILTISFENTDKVFATQILNSAVGELENQFDEMTMSGVLEKKRFLEESIAQYGKELEQAQQDLINFQKNNKIIDIGLQTEYQLNALADLDRQIIGKESQLEAAKKIRRSDDPAVLSLMAELNLLATTRDLIRMGRKDEASALDIPLADLPELAALYTNLLGNIEILRIIYSGLRSQYETTKIEEKDNSERFQVVEVAEIPEIKAGPSRGKICVIVTMSVFFLSIFISFIFEYFERVKLDPTESEKLSAIKNMLRKPKKK
ncbi:MAG: hypothetical protein HN368_15170 [Spirochaetales bacterium]|jgi:tyrosine-protein kinase Etk/Wzc|nr:hypothetical protein [Spirochaetales bacterium]